MTKKNGGELIGFDEEILKTVSYFYFFFYPPTLEEIYKFLRIKADKRSLKKRLVRLINEKILQKDRVKGYQLRSFLEKRWLLAEFRPITKDRYTLGEYCIKAGEGVKQRNKQSGGYPKFGKGAVFSRFRKRVEISKQKLSRLRLRFYLNLLSFFPQIKLVGLSGSIAMLNGEREDDIDLFIVTEKKRLWTGRLIAVLIAWFLGIKRRPGVVKAPDKVCLNLFFDKRELTIPQFKRTVYVAHEVLQMRPLINKEGVYEKFLEANQWVFKIFPNARKSLKIKAKNGKSFSKERSSLGKFRFLSLIINRFSLIVYSAANVLEEVVKRPQLVLINKGKTKEIITNCQLWFHPQDFSQFHRGDGLYLTSH